MATNWSVDLSAKPDHQKTTDPLGDDRLSHRKARRMAMKMTSVNEGANWV
jgi:hypothetical protein